MARTGQVTPPVQRSSTSHNLSGFRARHTVVFGSTASVGHVPELPVQYSTASQGPAAARHTVDGGAQRTGQSFVVPLHTSSTSQGSVPFAGRQTTLAALTPSGGQAAAEPVQVSATSHGPVAGRHTVEAGRNVSAGQPACVPVQVSATSHGPAEGRHTVVDGANTSGGQSALTPSQVSATSQPAAEAGRHTVDAGERTSGGQVGPVPGQASAGSHGPRDGRHVVADERNWSAGH
jgi:hypothetical protein